jgi:hypothetical protein
MKGNEESVMKSAEMKISEMAKAKKMVMKQYENRK